MTDDQLVTELASRLSNSAISDAELLTYIMMSKRDVSISQYTATNYYAQVLDTACVYLCDDNKFPEISSVDQGGVSTSFASNDPQRFQKRIEGRRQAAWMRGLGT